MALTALLTFMVAEHVISNELVETGGGNTVLIPFAFFACFLSLFHGIIKPATTSLIILFIQFFVTPSEEIKTLISQRRQENKEGREIVSSELKKILDFIRYTIILAVIVFLISIRAMDALDLGQQVLGPSLAPYTFDMFLHMFGHAEMLIWFSLIAWFSLSSIMSPQRSLIAKIMRKQGKDPIQSKNIIVTAGAISFALLIGGISADVKLFPGMDKNNSESIILQTTQASTPYYSYSTTKQIFRSQPELFEYLNTSPPPAQDYGWLYDLAKKKPKGPKRNKIFQTIKNLKQKHIAEHYEKANEKALSTKYKTLKQLLFIIVSATSAAVFLGALTTISTQLLMYAASAISVCFIFSLTVTGDLSMLARGVTYIIEYFQWFYQHNFQTSNFNS